MTEGDKFSRMTEAYYTLLSKLSAELCGDGDITADLRRKMPDGWDGTDVFARYIAAGIALEKELSKYMTEKEAQTAAHS